MILEIDDTTELSKKLTDWFRPFRSCVVAFSGGLDSTVVAKAASLGLNQNAVAVMAESESGFRDEVDRARIVAEAIPIRFVSFRSDELRDPAYAANDRLRCYYCKRIRFDALVRYARTENFELVVDGSNADDQNDYRPGRRALEEFDIRSPLAELGIEKRRVRELARFWGLPNREMPASPCLSTRLAYGLAITDERLRKIERAELFLQSLGFSLVRVRLHPDNLVRIEVSADELKRIMSPEIRKVVLETMKEFGFDFISVDLCGFRSGSMNVSVREST